MMAVSDPSVTFGAITNRSDDDRCCYVSETYAEYRTWMKEHGGARQFSCPCSDAGCMGYRLKWGEKNCAHLARIGTPGSATGCGMTLEHASAQLAIEKQLNDGHTINVTMDCADCRILFVRPVKLQIDETAKREYRYDTTSRRSADIAVLNADGQTTKIIEVLHTSRTEEASRPDDIEWYEVHSRDVLGQCELLETGSTSAMVLSCTRRVHRLCDPCIRLRNESLARRNVAQGVCFAYTCALCFDPALTIHSCLCRAHMDEVCAVLNNPAELSKAKHRAAMSYQAKSDTLKRAHEQVTACREWASRHCLVCWVDVANMACDRHLRDVLMMTPVAVDDRCRRMVADQERRRRLEQARRQKEEAHRKQLQREAVAAREAARVEKEIVDARLKEEAMARAAKAEEADLARRREAGAQKERDRVLSQSVQELKRRRIAVENDDREEEKTLVDACTTNGVRLARAIRDIRAILPDFCRRHVVQPRLSMREWEISLREFYLLTINAQIDSSYMTEIERLAYSKLPQELACLTREQCVKA